MDRLLDVARSAALKAGSILREHISEPGQVKHKGAIDLVTEMDRLSERSIVEDILRAFPEHGILAEEDARIESASAYRWIIDPLDGTTNYAHGYPNFAVSLGVERDGEAVVGVVYDPMRDELFSAVRGEGARLNSRQIGVSRVAQLIGSLLATGFPYDRAVSAENNLDYFNALIMASQEVRRSGSASLDLCSVAAGRLDGFWELKLRPWDVAAGSLIVRESGGVVTDLDGAGFTIESGEIAASNGIIHDQIIEILRNVRKQRGK